jgi:hypothetical protein
MTRNDRIHVRALDTYNCMRVLLDICRVDLSMVTPDVVEAIQTAHDIVRFVEEA